MAGENKNNGRAAEVIALLLGGTGTLLGGLALARKPAEAAPGGTTTTTVVLDDAIKIALATLLQGQQNIEGTLEDLLTAVNELGTAVNLVNTNLSEIAAELGVQPAQKLSLDLFDPPSQALNKGTPFQLYAKPNTSGSLLWAIVDVSDPNCKVTFQFDTLKWDFEYVTLSDQGIDRAMIPGVWLSKYDASNGHYVMVFSAGTPQGFPFSKQLQIAVTYHGTNPSCTLNQGRGIALVGA